MADGYDRGDQKELDISDIIEETETMLKKSLVGLSDKDFNYMLFSLRGNKKYRISKEDETKLINNLALIMDSDMAKYKKDLFHFNVAPPEDKPIIVDIDLSKKYSSDYVFKDGERIVSSKMIKELIMHYGKAIRKVYGDSVLSNWKYPLAFVCTRSKVDISEDDGGFSMKDGIHITFPGIVCCRKIQRFIRKEVLKTAFEEGNELFEFRSVRDHVVDKLIIEKTKWCLYGHTYSKEVGGKKKRKKWKPVYKISHIIDSISGKFLDLKKFKLTDGKLLKLLSIRGRPVSKNLKIEYTPEEPEILKKDSVVSSSGMKISDNELKFWKKVLEKLDQKRFSEYEEWKKTGLVIASAFGRNEKMYDIWTEICDNVDDPHSFHNHKHYSDLWNNADDRWTKDVILSFLRSDDINFYNQIIKKNVKMMIRNTKEEFTDNTVAIINSKILGDKYAVSFESSKKGTLYMFEEDMHRWKKCNNYVLLQKALLDEALPVWKEVLIELIQEKASWQSNNIDNDLKSKKPKETPYDYLIGEVRRVCKEMGSVTKLVNVTTYLKMRLSFIRPHFEDFLNSNPSLFVCRNGVLDFTDDIFTFRDGRQDDYMSIASDIEWKQYDPNDEMTKEMHKFLRDIYVDKDIHDYVIDLIARCLVVNDWDNRIFCMLGGGSNGKTKFFELVKMVFGYKNYYTNIASEVFTQKMKSGAPQPEKMLIKYKRIISVNEVGEGETFDDKAILEISGGATLAGVRNLFENSENSHFKVLGRLFFQLNDIPKVSSDGLNFTRRIRIIPHKTIFLYKDDKKYDEKNKYHKLIDKKLHIKLKSYAQPFLSYLVHVYKNRIMGSASDVEQLNEPPAVMEATNAYFSKINKIGSFIEKYLTPKKGNTLLISTIYYKYTNWMREMYEGERVMVKAKFIQNFSERMKKHLTMGGNGIKDYDFTS